MRAYTCTTILNCELILRHLLRIDRMSFIHPSIFFIDLKVLWVCIYQNLRPKHFHWKLVLMTITFIPVVLLVMFFVVFLRLLDEILFFGYRKTEVKEPVFIISNPRSGTTYMHRLLCLDEDRFAYFLLYHTVFSSITFYKFIQGMSWIDRRIGRPFRKFFDWVDRRLFARWKDIHPMGWNHSEEDEAQFFFAMTSPAIGIISPYMQYYSWIFFPDRYSQKKGDALMKYYKNCLQRFLYAEGKGKTLLSKNVLSTGRINLLLKHFPDAKVIYPVRHPYKAVPSLTSMFRVPWQFYAPHIKDDSEECRVWIQLAIDFYAYWHTESQNIPEDKYYTLKYDDLVTQPKDTVLKIYERFGLEVNEKFEKRLNELTARSKNYQSSHKYSVDQYGITKEQIYQQLEAVFEEHGFER